MKSICSRMERDTSRSQSVDNLFNVKRPEPLFTELDRQMRRIAYAARENSKDPSTKVGAVVYDDRGLIGSGFNRFPNGTPAPFWEDCKLKYAHIIHAEVVALLDAGRSARGCSMGST